MSHVFDERPIEKVNKGERDQKKQLEECRAALTAACFELGYKYINLHSIEELATRMLNENIHYSQAKACIVGYRVGKAEEQE